VARYEIYDDGVASFWDITLSGRSFSVRWGRVPGRGQGQVKQFDTAAEARAAYEKQIATKQKKGYRLVKGTEEPEAVARSADPVDVVAPRNPQLEAAAQLDPNDEGPLLVLGDWLQSQGDPRGELLALQVAQKKNADPAGFVTLKRAIDAHYAAHEAAILGALYPWRHLLKLEWNLGFIRAARLSFEARHADDPPMAQLLDELTRLPSAVVLQELALGNPGDGPTGKGRYQEAIDQLCRSAQPSTLRTLFLGDVWPGSRALPFGFLGDLRGLGAAFPALSRVVISGGNATFGKLPNLKTLEHKAEADSSTLAWLGAAAWPELGRLTLTLHQPRFIDQNALLEARRFPQLRQLRLLDTVGTAGWCEALAASTVLPQLELLDLDDGDLDDGGASWLIEHWASFGHLKTFRLGKQHLSWTGVRRLRELQVNVLDPK
jgi:uncharacterized protein (TIGR02996 family)